jgi:hypothetical protein
MEPMTDNEVTFETETLKSLDALNEAVASLPSALKAAGFDPTRSLQGLASEIGGLQKVLTAMSQSPALHMTPAGFAAELTQQADVIAERRFQEFKTSAAAENAWAWEKRNGLWVGALVATGVLAFALGHFIQPSAPAQVAQASCAAPAIGASLCQPDAATVLLTDQSRHDGTGTSGMNPLLKSNLTALQICAGKARQELREQACRVLVAPQTKN